MRQTLRVWIVAILALAFMPMSSFASTTWNVGDLAVAVSGGCYQIRDNAGLLKETICDGLGYYTTGCAWNPLLTRLYTTNFSSTKVVAYDNVSPHAILQVVDTGAASPFGHTESIVFDALGNYYVGHPDGNDLIHKYDAAGNLLTTYAVAVDFRGTDWIDLAADQSTLYYTSEGRAVQVYDTLLNVQLANFAALPGFGNAFALRLLPPGNGSGGLLVADGSNIKRLDGTGTVVQTYDVAGENSWFSLNLDLDGVTFWAGDFGSANIYRIDIVTGVVVSSFNTGTGGYTVFGVCLKGEPTAGTPIGGRMTGGGSVFTADGSRVTHGFELHCNKNSLPNNLQINWNDNRFHLTSLDSATCTDDPSLDEDNPVAGFDTFVGSGTGRLNGVDGATIDFKLTDDGEPGKDVDLAEFSINGGATLTVSGILDKGNQQAHP